MIGGSLRLFSRPTASLPGPVLPALVDQRKDLRGHRRHIGRGTESKQGKIVWHETTVRGLDLSIFQKSMQPSSLASRPEEPSQQAYGRAAVRGAMWSVLGVATIQGLSLLSQLVLGHVLARAEVGIYAMAASFSGLVVILRNCDEELSLHLRNQPVRAVGAGLGQGAAGRADLVR